MDNFVGCYLVVNHSRPDKSWTSNHEILSVSDNSFVIELGGKEVTINCDINQFIIDPSLRTNESYEVISNLFTKNDDCIAFIRKEKKIVPSKSWIKD